MSSWFAAQQTLMAGFDPKKDGQANLLERAETKNQEPKTKN